MVQTLSKRIIALVLSVVLILSLVACGETPKETAQQQETGQSIETENGKYTAGTYTATAPGRNGPITVEVTFDSNGATEAKVIEHVETVGIADVPMERIPKVFVESQSLKIDAITGATETSNAILAAIADCISQAGGNPEDLMKIDIKTQGPGESVEMVADIVIIGGGGAGMSVAVTAVDNGASVIVVEKTAALGGNTLRSGGGFNSAGPVIGKNWEQTKGLANSVQSYIDLEPKNEKMKEWQNIVKKDFDEHMASGAKHLFDSEEFHMLQTYVEGDYIGDPDLIELMCRDAKGLTTWGESLGGTYNLDAKGVLGMGSIWPRAYNLIGGHGQGGGKYFELFDKHLEGAPIEYAMEVEAKEFIMEDGKIVGVKGEKIDGTSYVFRAKKAVILASGGFTANVEMREKYNIKWDYIGENLPISGSPANTGDGHRMAEAIGAKLVDMSEIQLQPLATASTGALQFVCLPSAPFINKNGERFVNEAERRDVMSKAILEQPDSVMYQIASTQNLWVTDGITITGDVLSEMIEKGDVVTADTLEGLATKLNIDPTTFIDTINQYNEAVTNKYDPLTGRVSFLEEDYIEETGPYWAHVISPSVHFTMGGVNVDTDLHVLDNEGNIIQGLYAAGEVAGGFHGGNRVGGNAITQVLRSGINAGKNATIGK